MKTAIIIATVLISASIVYRPSAEPEWCAFKSAVESHGIMSEYINIK